MTSPDEERMGRGMKMAEVFSVKHLSATRWRLKRVEKCRSCEESHKMYLTTGK